jgi:hypothetical protein
MVRTVVSVLAMLVALALLGTTVACGQAARTFARIQGDNGVEILDLRKESWHRIYRSPKWGVTGLSVAPSGDRLAFLSWIKGTVSGHDYAVPPAAELVVIDTAGRAIASVPNVHRYDWCGETCLIYITGVYRESEVGFHPSGVGMIDLTTGRTTALPAPRYPIGIRWGPLDGAAYIKIAQEDGQLRILRVDLRNRASSLTDLKDHLFSPTGRYYLHRPHFTDSMMVYDTRSNAPVDISTLLREAKPIGWAVLNDDVLLALRRRPAKAVKPEGRVWVRPLKPGDIREETYLLYRVSAARVVGQVKARLGPGASPADFRLIQEGVNYKVVDQH